MPKVYHKNTTKKKKKKTLEPSKIYREIPQTTQHKEIYTMKITWNNWNNQRNTMKYNKNLKHQRNTMKYHKKKILWFSFGKPHRWSLSAGIRHKPLRSGSISGAQPEKLWLVCCVSFECISLLFLLLKKLQKCFACVSFEVSVCVLCLCCSSNPCTSRVYSSKEPEVLHVLTSTTGPQKSNRQTPNIFLWFPVHPAKGAGCCKKGWPNSNKSTQHDPLQKSLSAAA